MVEDGLLGKILAWASTSWPAAIWAGLLLNAGALFKYWGPIMARRNERKRDLAAEEAGDWERLRSERDNARAERDRIHTLWIKCEEEKMTLLSRAITAEATLLGMGVARQQVTILQGIPEKPETGK